MAATKQKSSFPPIEPFNRSQQWLGSFVLFADALADRVFTTTALNIEPWEVDLPCLGPAFLGFGVLQPDPRWLGLLRW